MHKTVTKFFLLLSNFDSARDRPAKLPAVVPAAAKP